MSKHSEGPFTWKRVPAGWIIHDKHGREILFNGEYGSQTEEEQEANIILMSASIDLLHACEDAVTNICTCCKANWADMMDTDMPDECPYKHEMPVCNNVNYLVDEIKKARGDENETG